MDDTAITAIVGSFTVGVGATAIMDLWAAFQWRAFNVPSLNYAMVGRWVGHMTKGRFFHESIVASSPIHNEKAIGWLAHYAIGIVFAGCVVALWGVDWLYHPTVTGAAIIGIGSVVAPFFFMQPGLGAGVLASRTPRPWLSRFRSIVAHASFAFGLYVSGAAVSYLI